MNPLKTEPVVTWASLAGILNAIQLLAIPGLPTWVHTLIVVASAVVATLASRQSVSPVAPASK